MIPSNGRSSSRRVTPKPSRSRDAADISGNKRAILAVSSRVTLSERAGASNDAITPRDLYVRECLFSGRPAGRSPGPPPSLSLSLSLSSLGPPAPRPLPLRDEDLIGFLQSRQPRGTIWIIVQQRGISQRASAERMSEGNYRLS